MDSLISEGIFSLSLQNMHGTMFKRCTIEFSPREVKKKSLVKIIKNIDLKPVQTTFYVKIHRVLRRL